MSGIGAMDTGGRNHSLPEINRSLDLASESKRRHSNKGVKLVDPVQLQAAQHRTSTALPTVDSLGLDSQAQAVTVPATAASMSEANTRFDTLKWKRLINGNVEMIQTKVDQSTPHNVLYRELDDLKLIVEQCFDHLSKSFGR